MTLPICEGIIFRDFGIRTSRMGIPVYARIEHLDQRNPMLLRKLNCPALKTGS